MAHYCETCHMSDDSHEEWCARKREQDESNEELEYRIGRLEEQMTLVMKKIGLETGDDE